MNKVSKILLGIWSILAILNFVFAFWIEPIVFMIAGLTFGTFNVIAIITWVLSYFVMKGNQIMLNKMIEEENKNLEKELEDGV